MHVGEAVGGKSANHPSPDGNQLLHGQPVPLSAEPGVARGGGGPSSALARILLAYLAVARHRCGDIGFSSLFVSAYPSGTIAAEKHHHVLTHSISCQ